MTRPMPCSVLRGVPRWALYSMALTGLTTACGPDRPPVEPAATAQPAAPAPEPEIEPDESDAEVMPEPEPTMSVVLLPPLASEGDLARWIDAPCLAHSASKQQLACIEATIDMGFTNVRFVVLSVADGSVVAEHKIYEGPTDVDVKKVDSKGWKAAEATLKDDGFAPGGAPVEIDDVKASDGKLTIAEPAMAATPPAFTAKDAPEGFKGNPGKCMRWEALGGLRYEGVAAIRIASAHDFVRKPGSPCHVAKEINDETFPAQERWLLLKP